MQGGPELYSITRDIVLSSSKDKYLRQSFLPLLLGNVSELIEKIDLEKWKEALSILIINNCSSSLVIEFAERLEQHSLFSAAQACFVYAGSSDRVLGSWIKQFRHIISSGGSYEDSVFNLFFKALLYAESLKFFDSEILESIYHEYLIMLFKHGMHKEAMEVLGFLKTPRYNLSLMILIEKHTKANNGNTKPPWKVLNINPAKSRVLPKSKEAYISESSPATKGSGFVKVPAPPDHARQVMSKESTIPDPRKSAFPDPRKTAFPEPVKELGKAAFPEPVKAAFSNVGGEVKKSTFPPPPYKEPYPAEVKKSPFGDQKEVTTDSKPISQTKSVQEKQILAPPPPVNFKEARKEVIPPPVSPAALKNTEARNIEPPPISRPTIVQEKSVYNPPPPQSPKNKEEFVQNRQEMHRPMKTEELKNKEVPPPIVPKAIPPPRIPTLAPQKAIPKAIVSGDGVDLSGISPDLLPMAQKWEAAIKDASISSNPRILKDVESKMQEFFNKLKFQGLIDTTLSLVVELTEAFTVGDLATVNRAHLELTNKTWAENGNWLTAMKRIIQAKQSTRGK